MNFDYPSNLTKYVTIFRQWSLNCDILLYKNEVITQFANYNIVLDFTMY